MKKQRDSGIELLRILAMFMVIAIHLFGYGNYSTVAENVGGLVESSALFLKLFFRPAVDIFIIITGYFMINSGSDFKKLYKRTFNTYLAVLFYSIVLSIITLAIGGNFLVTDGVATPVSDVVARMFFPFSGRYWYFLTDYILLMLIVPFLNIVLTKITKKQYILLLCILTYVLSIWQLLTMINPFSSFIRAYGYDAVFEGKNIFAFTYMYIIGGFISLHVKKADRPKMRYALIAVLSVLVNYYIYTRLGDTLGYEHEAITYANPFVILSGVSMFMFFKDLHFTSRIINLFGSTTIGVYAISEFKFIREWLWNIFDFKKFDCTNLLMNFAMIIGVIVVVFVTCSVLELIRQKLFVAVEFLIKKAKQSRTKITKAN